MANKFKSKGKKKRLKIIKYILILGLLYLIYSLCSLILLNVKLADNNEDFVKKILTDSNYHMLYEKRTDNIIYKLFNILSNLNIKKPITVLENGFNYKINSNDSDAKLIYNEEYDNTVEEVVKYMGKDEKINNPIVYIYNTHQTEEYSKDYMEGYNITPNVLMASYMLKEKLDKLGIPTLVEESNISEFLRINNWTYSDSYKASRFYLLDTINKYSSVKLFIDLHRDSISKDNSTVKINNKSYAKVLFVVGKENKNYQTNLDLATNLNNKINSSYDGLSRGITLKEGEKVNGIYNQDLNSNITLIEVGGSENNITEVLNTIEALSNVIGDYINEK